MHIPLNCGFITERTMRISIEQIRRRTILGAVYSVSSSELKFNYHFVFLNKLLLHGL